MGSVFNFPTVTDYGTSVAPQSTPWYQGSWVAPTAQALATTAQGVQQAHSNTSAVESQLAGTEQGIAALGQQSKQRRIIYEEMRRRHRMQWEQWNAARDQLLRSYGIDIANEPSSATGQTLGQMIGGG